MTDTTLDARRVQLALDMLKAQETTETEADYGALVDAAFGRFERVIRADERARLRARIEEFLPV